MEQAKTLDKWYSMYSSEISEKTPDCFKELLDDFFKVAEEYIGRLGRLASDTRVATSLENAGQLIPVEVLNKNFQGKLTSR